MSGPSGAWVLHDDLVAAARSWPDRCGVRDASGSSTWAELLAASEHVASRLLLAGLAPGDRVAVVMRAGRLPVAALYGTSSAGLCIVVLDPHAPVERLVALLDHCGASAVVCDEGTASSVRQAAARAGRDVVVLLLRDDALTDRPATVELLARRPLGVDLAALVYTSGSTGRSRAAVFLHRNLEATVALVQASLPVTAADRVLSTLPLSHTYGLYQVLLAVRTGATLDLRSALLVGDLLRVLREQQTTVLPGVPALWHALLGDAGSGTHPSVRVVTNAGAALPPALGARLRTAFPAAEVFAMYGQTECGRACVLPADRFATHPDAVGFPLPGTDGWLVDQDGREPPDGEVGELHVRGEHVMQGYWRDAPATTAKLVPGRWPGDRVLRTGDLFRRDAAGHLCFVARRDDMITTSGEKVAPLEVERVLASADGVGEAAVLGVLDARRGQRVVAHVAPRAGAVLDPEALRRHCRVHLEPSKVPTQVTVHDHLPHLSNGKVDRVALSASAAGAGTGAA
ncbi:MAG: AMP-dependent synthetase and ligase [Frankiales bacterium]|nr:AMP-dependent synthetase and ligase [Frankiales bacterium]